MLVTSISPLLTMFSKGIFLYPPKLCLGVCRSQLVGRSVRPSVCPSVRRSVCSFLSTLFLINYWTNFIQTSQVNSVSSRDVHMKCWLWFIDFSLSYAPFMFCDKELFGGMITFSDSSSFLSGASEVTIVY